MRYNKNLFDIIQTGEFVGPNRAHGRITVEPDWRLRETPPSYGNSVRGPFRWYQDVADDSVEYEIPNVKSISIDRSVSQGIATCNFSIYNQWHHLNTESPELAGQLGKPGYFWFDRGKANTESTTRWSQSEAFGANTYDGIWEEEFSWRNIIVPHALIRTYQGYGGFNSDGSPKSIAEAVNSGNLVITGTWLIDTVSAGTDGLINITCRDIGRLLIDQFAFPPLIPNGLYPLEYYPPGKSAFDSPWGPPARQRNGISLASRGEVKMYYSRSSLDIVEAEGDYSLNGHKGSHSVDGNWSTYSLSEAYPKANSSDGIAWFEFDVNKNIDSLSLKCWAGGYRCYVSVRVGGVWVQPHTYWPSSPTQTIPWTAGANNPYPGEEFPSNTIVNKPRTLTAGQTVTCNGATLRMDYDGNLSLYGDVPIVGGGRNRGRVWSTKTSGNNGAYAQFQSDGNLVVRNVKGNTIWQSNTDGQGSILELQHDQNLVIRNSSGTVIWQTNTDIPVSLADDPDIPYWKAINIPAAAPEGMEPEINISFDRAFLAEKVRISFRSLYYSSIADGSRHYRAGIRDVVAYKTGNPTGQFEADYGSLPWTYSIAAHPTRGYWVADSNGRIHGFGDAADYDSNAFGDVPFDKTVIDNYIISIAAHPSGKGYWTLDRLGVVHAYGAAVYHGHKAIPKPSSKKYLDSKTNTIKTAPNFGFDYSAMDIAPTHTGNGYWVVYGNGVFKGFGDAAGIQGTVPTTTTHNNMIRFFQHDGDDHKDNIFYTNGGGWPAKRATAIASHPKELGCWIVNGHGEVFAYGAAKKYGQLESRIYKKGSSSSFTLGGREWGKNIESTKTGKGYWIAFGGGRIAAFGDAINNGTADVYGEVRKQSKLGVQIPESDLTDFSFFRYLVWDLARDPDGKGFWVLIANGDVLSYNAEFWGKPGYWGLTGYRWHDGNYDDYADIVKEVLMWAGFTLYDSGISSTTAPSAYGNIENTGIKTDTVLPATMFDKKSCLDIIKQLAEVTGYLFYIQEDGSVRFESQNWWRPGNFDENGQTIYIDESGNRVNKEDWPQPTFPSDVVHYGLFRLDSGEEISCNGARLVMQSDGNLVLYANSPTVGRYYKNRGAVWMTATQGHPGAYVIFGTNGNLVVYSSTGSVLWQSKTPGHTGATLHLQHDQNLVIYSSDSKPIWSTGTNIDVSELPPTFIPVIDETIDMLNYNVNLNWDGMRSELIVGTEAPDPSNPSATGYTRYKPPASYEQVAPGVPALRNIVRPAMRINTNFTNKKEVKLMLEIMALRSFFSQRTGSISCVGNPCITINDQVKIYERNTSETYIHYVQSINSQMDLDTGIYTSSITTNWLGDRYNWVIAGSTDGQNHYLDRFIISEELDVWQTLTGRELDTGNAGKGSVPKLSSVTGEFTSMTVKI